MSLFCSYTSTPSSWFLFTSTLSAPNSWLRVIAVSVHWHTNQSNFFLSSVPSKFGKRKEFHEDLKQKMVNLARKGYCWPRIGQLVNKTHSAVQYKFKYTGSIKNEPRKPKKRILSARPERYVLEKIRGKKILGCVPRNCEELLKILQEKLCVTKQFAACCISMTFMVEKSNNKRKTFGE